MWCLGGDEGKPVRTQQVTKGKFLELMPRGQANHSDIYTRAPPFMGLTSHSVLWNVAPSLLDWDSSSTHTFERLFYIFCI